MPWLQRFLWPLQCALAWVGLECLRGWMFTGFPWNYLANSQLDLAPLAMFASITGVLGISLIVVWCSVSLLVATTGSIHLKGAKRYGRIGKDAAPALGFLIIAMSVASVYSITREDQLSKRGVIRIALVQPSIPQHVIFSSLGNNSDATHERAKALGTLTLEANKTDPDLIVWPEASAPFGVIRLAEDLENRLVTGHLGQLVTALGKPMVVGADETIGVIANEEFKREQIRNSCFYFNENGDVAASYSKQHLVMFGEYVPLGDWLPFLKKLAPVGTFTSGNGPIVFDLGKAKAAPVICFEDVVPELVRRAATDEVDFILNLTNDGWFGESNQQWQHARTAAFRAIETGRPLVRCTNNGLTCWVDRFGKIHRLEQGSIYEPGVRILELPLMNYKGGRSTFYQRTGDWMGWGSVIICFLMIAWKMKQKNDSAEEAELT